MNSEVIELRRLCARDFALLLETESRIWEATLRWDHDAMRRLLSSCLEERRLTGYALRAGGRLRGYGFFFREGPKGLLGNLFVGPGESRLEWARTLLNHLLETLRAMPGVGRIETQLPHFTFEELDSYFRAQAFQGYLRRFMAAPLPFPGLRAGDHNSGEGVHGQEDGTQRGDFLIETWDRKYDIASAHLVFAAYRGHADTKINDQYASVAGIARLIENIIQHRGCGEYIPETSLVALHRSTHKLAGVLTTTRVRAHTAHVPQIAVSPEFQRRGVGTALMKVSFAGLFSRGYREVSLTVTDLNAGAVRLYERLGFETFRTFGAFTWNRS